MNCPACGHLNLPGVDECKRCQESLTQDDVPQPATPVERSIMFDPLASLSPPAPECLSVNTSADEAVAHMQGNNIGYVLVTDDDQRLVGILTERDLLLKVAGLDGDLGSMRIAEIMTPNPTVLHASEPVKHALFLMAHNGFRHIPLVDEANRPQGITTVRHVVQYIAAISPRG